MSSLDRIIAASFHLRGGSLTPEEQKELELVKGAFKARGMPLRNPFVSKSKYSGKYEIAFMVPTKSNPLWWIGSGFKDLSRVRAEAEEFETQAEAERKVKGEILNDIRRWRSDQVHLIMGW